jgi:HEAT repeat protein
MLQRRFTPLVACAGLLLACPQAGAQEKPNVTELIQQLQKGGNAERVQAAQALGKLGADARDAVPHLVEALRQPAETGVAPAAAQALAQVGAPAVPDLAEVLKDKNGDVRAYAAGVLARIGPPARDAVPALTDLVKKDKEPRPAGALPPTGMARVFAIQALGRIGPDAKASVPALTDVLTEKPANEEARISAVVALGQIGPGAGAAVPALSDVVKNGKGVVRLHAVNSLGQIGPDAREAVPVLKQAAQDKYLRAAAEKALARVQENK